MKRWQRLNIFLHKPDYFPGYVRNLSDSLTDIQQYSKDDDQRSRRAYDIDDCAAIALLGHFEYDDHPFGDVCEFGRKAAEIAVDFFYGDWRDKYLYEYVPRKTYLNRQQCRERLDWFVSYRRGLMWSLILDEEQYLTELLQWPDSDLPPQHEINGVMSGDVFYHIVLARYLRGELNSEDTCFKKAQRRKRHKLQLKTLKSIQDHDAVAFSEALQEVIDDFLVSEGYGSYLIEDFVCPEVTILWHVARRSGLELPKLDELRSDMVVTRESMRCVTG